MSDIRFQLGVCVQRTDTAVENQVIGDLSVSFASDTIVADPQLGALRLSLEPTAMDLSRAIHGLPVYEMHQRSLPVGRILNVRREGNQLRGDLRFSQSPRGQSLKQDSLDGIITDLSVGAHVHEVVPEQGFYIATRWQPYEVSLVDAGADQSVGINRIKPPMETSMSEENTPQQPTAIPVTPQPVAAVTMSDSQNTINIMELARYAAIRAPELTNVQLMAEDFTQFGRPFNEFRDEVWRMLNERNQKQPAAATPAEIGLTPKETKQFSICRAALASLTNNWKGAEFELEASRAVSEKINRAANGFFVPFEVQREMATGTGAGGGYIVPTEYRGDMFIESLRAQSVALQAGVRTLPGLQGLLSIPKQTGNATFAWIAEGADSTLSDLTFTQISMSPNTITGGVGMTRRMLMQSSPAIEALVRSDLVTGCALAIDKAVFQGAGTLEPLGITAQSGIGTVSITTAGSPTWAEVVGFETALANALTLQGSLGFVTTPSVRGKLKTTVKESGTGLFLLEGNQLNGYPVHVCSQLASNRILFGDFSQCLVGFWGVLDVKADEATKAASGGLILRVFQDADVVIRHPESFAINTTA